MGEEYIYVAVDETGNLGKSLKGERYYTLVACVVNDRKRFEDATRRLGFNEEVKFYTHECLREKVLKYAAPSVSEVFYVRYHKGRKAMDRHEQPDTHLRLVQVLADTIVKDYSPTNNLVVEVDHKDGISDSRVCQIFENNGYRDKIIVCDVLDSDDSYGLQTNDFFVGAIGHMLNFSDFRYVDLFSKRPEPCYYSSKSVKKNQGEPASTTLAEYRPHGQSLTDSPPGIATGLMCLTPGQREVGSPVVRLGNESSERYLRSGSRSKVRFFEDRRRQGEPASATRNTGHTDNPFEMDSPPGIAIQLRTPRAGYPMVRLGRLSESSYLKGRRGSGRLFGSVKRHKI